ncbi:MAG: dephospho-CoA kinase, partial [Candidatus Saccharibacteria bacterium]|nr:dephospho-CoA kinase [Candidatus Saccharibacteria bacterium]
SVIVDYLTSTGVPRVYFGGMIIRGVKERGWEVNEENERKFREEIRVTEGKDWVVRQVIKEIHELTWAGQRRVVLDGLYSWTEYKILKKEFPEVVTMLAILTPKKLRYKRVGQREVRPLSLEEIRARDKAEIENLEKGGPIAMADYFVVNEGTVEETRKKVERVLKEIRW